MEPSALSRKPTASQTPTRYSTLLVLCMAASLPATLIAPAVAGDTPGLLQAYEDALEADTELQAARHGKEAAREREREAFGAWLPSVTATGGVDRVRRDERDDGLGGDEDPRTFTREQYRLRLEQPIYNQRNWERMRQVEHQGRASQFEYASAQQDLISRVAGAYFEVQLAELEIELAEREVDALASEAQRIEALYERELASRADRAEVRAALEEARSEALSSRHRLDSAHEALREITDRRYYDLRSVGEDIPVEPPHPADMEYWIEQAMDNNPRLLAARFGRQSRRDEVAVERAGHYPTLDLVASHTYFDDVDDEADLPIGTQGRRFDETVIGLQLTIPLYSGGQVSARSRAAEQDAARIDQQVEGLHRALTSQVRASFLDVERSVTTVAALERSVAAETERIEAIEEELEIGRRSVIDLLNARRDRFRSRLALARARIDYLNARVALESAAGELDEDTVAWLDGLLVAAP